MSRRNSKILTEYQVTEAVAASLYFLFVRQEITMTRRVKCALLKLTPDYLH